MTTEAEYRLPRTVIPTRYELTLAPDLDAASFVGHAAVAVDVVETVTEISVNAAELQISDVEMVGGPDQQRVPAHAVRYDVARERATFTFDEELRTGSWKLLTSFKGILNDDLRGFYRSTYKDEDGVERVIATTQFEATDARRAFPCWDEPDLKATFSVNLEVDADLIAISNGAEMGTAPGTGNKIVHRFADTMKMSTYLVAFIVGDFEVRGPVDAGGVPLRVIQTPGKGNLADFALEVGAFALQYFAEYYEIPYPGDKLDMIAVPDFAAGAMENLGAVTYRETALLVDKERATRGELTRVADVIAHELAHMWFGDLVTMKWWNGIWLNEAFATFMELKCIDAFRPDWNRWLSFAHYRAHSMDVDGLVATRPVEYPVASPADAEAMFDTLTYGKGSAVLRMLEQYLGKETFRRGIVTYLKRHAYSNTDTDDLWAALEGESGEPVGEIMSGWIYQGGYPQLDVSVADGGYLIEQHHFRFLGEGDQKWQVPALYRTGEQSGRIVVGDGEFVPSAEGSILVNDGGDGFYRVNYPTDVRARLANEFADLAPAERYALLADTWANVLAGETAAAEFVSLVGALDDEHEPDVWGVAVGGLAELDRVISSDDRPAMQQMVRNLVKDHVSELGWVPDEGETDQKRRLRALLLRTAGTLGDDVAVQEAARNVFEAFQADPASTGGDVADAAVGIVAANGSVAEFERLLEMRDQATSPQDEVRYLRAAAAVPDRATAERLVDMVLAGEVRSQDSNWLLARLLGHRETGPAVWEMVKENWDDLLAAMPAQHKRRMLDMIMYRSEPDIAADIESWLTGHPFSASEQFTAQQLERLRVRVGLRKRESSRLGDAIG